MCIVGVRSVIPGHNNPGQDGETCFLEGYRYKTLFLGRGTNVLIPSENSLVSLIFLKVEPTFTTVKTVMFPPLPYYLRDSHDRLTMKTGNRGH